MLFDGSSHSASSARYKSRAPRYIFDDGSLSRTNTERRGSRRRMGVSWRAASRRPYRSAAKQLLYGRVAVIDPVAAEDEEKSPERTLDWRRLDATRLMPKRFEEQRSLLESLKMSQLI